MKTNPRSKDINVTKNTRNCDKSKIVTLQTEVDSFSQVDIFALLQI